MTGQLFHQLGKRNDKHTRKNVAHAVDHVKRNSRDDPRDRLLKIESKHECLGRCVKRSERKSVQGANDGIHDTRNFKRHFFRQKHGERPKDRPDIKIREPPEVKARKQSVKHNVNIDRNESLCAVNDRIGHRQHSEQVNVGQYRHNDLGAVHQGSEHGKDHELLGLQSSLSSCIFI